MLPANNATSDPDDQVDQPQQRVRGRRAATICLYICLLIAGIFAAWQGHLYWRSADQGEAGRRIKQDFGFGAMASPNEGEFDVRDQEWIDAEESSFAETQPIGQNEPASDPEDIMTRPLELVGIEPFTGNPGGLAPPSGAKQRFAFRSRIADTIQQQATVDYVGDIADAAKHYKASMQHAEFNILKDDTERYGRRMLVGRRGQQRAIVVLRRNKPSTNMIEITVTVIKADSQ